MAKQINCPCGEELTGADEDEVVSRAEEHVREKHREMAGTMTREQFVGMMQDA